MKISLLVCGTLCVAALCVFQTEGRVNDRVSTSVEVMDSRRKMQTQRQSDRDSKQLKRLGFIRKTRTEEYRARDGERMVKTSYIYSAATSPSKVLKHVDALAKQFPHIFTEATVAEYHKLAERYQKGDSQMRAILRSHPRLQITFTVTRAKDARRRKRLIGVLFKVGLGLYGAGKGWGWWGR